MEEKVYSSLQLKRVYTSIIEALDEKRKEEIANVMQAIAEKMYPSLMLSTKYFLSKSNTIKKRTCGGKL